VDRNELNVEDRVMVLGDIITYSKDILSLLY